jgi:hypothetical protein
MGTFFENRVDKEKEYDVKLLKALELCDDEMFNLEEVDEERMVLSDEIVASIEAARSGGMNVEMQPCEKKRKNNRDIGANSCGQTEKKVE